MLHGQVQVGLEKLEVKRADTIAGQGNSTASSLNIGRRTLSDLPLNGICGKFWTKSLCVTSSYAELCMFRICASDVLKACPFSFAFPNHV